MPSPPTVRFDFRQHVVSRAPLFCGLGTEVRTEIVRLSRERRIVRKECFYLQGDPAEDVFVLCAGRVKFSLTRPDGQEALLQIAGPGEAFGAIDVREGGAYPTGAEGLEASHALIWSREALDAIGERHPVLLRNVRDILAARLRELEQRCADASQRVPQRVASTLVRLAEEMGRPVDGGVLVGLSREELAQMTGTTLFTVSRLLSEWQTSQLVATRREAVVVTNAAALAAAVPAGRADPFPGGPAEKVG